MFHIVLTVLFPVEVSCKNNKRMKNVRRSLKKSYISSYIASARKKKHQVNTQYICNSWYAWAALVIQLKYNPFPYTTIVLY